MAETTDDLTAPLGQNRQHGRRKIRLPFTGMQALAVLLGLFLAAFAGFAIFGHSPLGGEPTVRIALPSTGASPGKLAEANNASSEIKPGAAAKSESQAANPVEHQTVTIIDGSSGNHHDIVISGKAANTKDPEAGPALMAGTDPRLVEKSRYGLIPAAADGLKPFNAYAGEADVAKAAKMPVVAIVIGGLGVGAAKTTDAIMKLPAAVTLAFTPYGADPGRLAERARAQQHEILLQVPMEPLDYPDNDPGPQTLLTTLGSEQNLDRLYWHLSRVQGYAGIANLMGARFVVNDTVMQPVIREAAKRGLGYLDDGSTVRSVAPALAAAQAVPFAKADLAIDQVPTASEVDRALAKLEAIARERGVAIGTASALPISIDRIASWTKVLEGRGILLVPLTTAMQKSKSS